MKEKRKNIRYLSSARIRVIAVMPGNQDLFLFLRDISITGCSITNAEPGSEARTDNAGADPGGLEANREYKIEIHPETEAKVEPFELAIELSWIRSENGVYEAGGFISGYPKGKRYQLFANYLAWRAASL